MIVSLAIGAWALLLVFIMACMTAAGRADDASDALALHLGLRDSITR